MTRALAMLAAIVVIAAGVVLFVFAATRLNRRSDADSERAALPNALPHNGVVSPEFARAAVRPPRPRVEFHDHLDVDAFIASLNPCGELPCRLHDPDQCRFMPCCPTCPTEKD